MRKRMLVLLSFFMAGVTFFLVLSLVWLAHGSFEICPTAEQQEKAKMAALLFAAALALTDVFLAAGWAHWWHR